MTKRRQAKLRSTQQRMLRQLIQSHHSYDDYDNYVDWIRGATNQVKEVMSQYGIDQWTTVQRARSWTWAGKVAHTADDRWNGIITACHVHSHM
jgi:hypothetical protein